VEIGLEPHRIARLVAHLKADTVGQYFLTTHSPVVLRELTVNDLHIVHCRDGVTQTVAAAKPAITDGIQGKVRSYAEAFLAPKIVVCEGATEVGFLRGLDDYWISQGKNSFAYQGVSPIDAASASKIKGIASGLRKLSYDVAVVADSGEPEQFSPADAQELAREEVAVIQWSSAMSIEQRVFADIPWSGVMASFKLACEIVGDRDKVIDHVQSQAGRGFDRDIAAWTASASLRAALGKLPRRATGSSDRTMRSGGPPSSCGTSGSQPWRPPISPQGERPAPGLTVPDLAESLAASRNAGYVTGLPGSFRRTLRAHLHDCEHALEQEKPVCR